jgi:SAM-dependent methyltransferase
MSEVPEIFDRAAWLRHRARAVSAFGAHDVLFREAADRLLDRLPDIRRRFPLAAELGARNGLARDLLAGRGGVERWVTSEPVAAFRPDVVAEPDFLPFAAASLDLVFANLVLHWVNDVPGALLQALQALKPDGLLLATMFGGETLRELRHALLAAELEVEGGAGPRVSPFIDVRDAGMLLQRAGFALPVVDAETLTLTYADPFALLRELRGMGETNAVTARRKTFTRRATLLRAAEIYVREFGTPDGRVPATFQIVTLTGWRPAASQQKPLRPGSAAARLATALGATEHSAGEKAGG